MEALLGAIRRNPSCASVDDLLLQVRDKYDAKVSQLRAEHITATLDIPTNVVLSLTVSESEHEALESAARHDPPPGRVSSGAGTGEGQALGDGTYLHRVNSTDAILNQPQDDPVVQRAVAKHITSTLGQVDGSTWTVRSMSRTAQGWTFIYSCKDSLATWLRLNSKVSRPTVGESSGKDGQDPINLARPAFDCRGSLTISFARSNRVITVKYEHTPMHKSVSQLVEYFAPPPEPAPTRHAKRKADAGQDGEGGQKPKKKRRKTRDGEAADGTAADGEPGAANGDGPRKKRTSTKPRKKKSGNQNEVAPADASTAQTQASQPGSLANTLLNLPPGEEARRRDFAEKLLSDSGIDPATLSLEQFNIFANQSPELQTESLAMLVKYGPERLRIVHPNRDASSASASPTPATPGQAGTSTPDSSAKKKNGRRKTGGQEGGSDADGGTPTTAKRTPKQRVTRGKCAGCRARKLKCGKEKPTCAQCEEAGNSCYYPLAEAKGKGAAGPGGEASEAERDGDDEDEEPDDLPSPGFSQPVMPEPVAQPVAPPEDSPDTLGPSTADWTADNAGMSFPPSVSHDVSQQSTATKFSEVNPQSPQRQPETPLGTAQQSPSSRTRSAPRRGPPNSQREQNEPAYDAAASAWRTLPHAAAPTSSTTNTVSPSMTFTSPSGRQSRSRKSASATTNDYQPADEGLQQVAALSQAAIEPPRRPSPAQPSPMQAPPSTSRARAKQSRRGHTRSSLPPQSTTSTQASQQSTMSSYTAQAPTEASTNYDSYSRYSTNTREQSDSLPTYDAYSNQSASNTSTSSYPTYDTYTTHSSNPSTSSYTAPVTQSVHSYGAAPTTTTNNQWPSASSQNTHSHNTNSSSSVSYNLPTTVSTQQTQDLSSSSSYNAQPGVQTRQSTRSTYQQQRPLPQQQQQQQQRGQPQQQQQQSSYSSYSSQPSTQNNQQQQNWYGYSAANTASSDYNAGTHSNGTGNYSNTHSGNSASYNQHHRSMDLSGRTYNMDTGDQTLYDLLRTNQGS